MRSGFTAAKKQPMTVVPVLGRVKGGENVERKRGSTPSLNRKTRGHSPPFFICIIFFIDTWDFLGYKEMSS